MPNKDVIVLTVQGFSSVLLLVGGLYLAATGTEVPSWLVNLIVFANGSWFAGSAALRVRNNKRNAVSDTMLLRRLEDGSWERIDGK